VVEWIKENEQQILTHQRELEQGGRAYFEDLRGQVFESDPDCDIDRCLVSEIVYSSSETDTETESSSPAGTADTERNGDNHENADDEECPEIADV